MDFVDREKTAPFLIRAFVKIGTFHRLGMFEENVLPTTDEAQLFTWKDATLSELATTLRLASPHIPEYRHPLARFSFRAVFADPSAKGQFTFKDLGIVYSRDILGQPETLLTTSLSDLDSDQKDTQTLEKLRFVPGDYMTVAVFLPKSVTAPAELSIKGSAQAPGNASIGWRLAATNSNEGSGFGRGAAGHWRGESNSAPARGRGDRGREGREGREGRDSDRRPRRDGSPPSKPSGWGDRGGRGGRGERGRGDWGRAKRNSRSRSPSPRRRRGGRHD